MPPRAISPWSSNRAALAGGRFARGSSIGASRRGGTTTARAPTATRAGTPPATWTTLAPHARDHAPRHLLPAPAPRPRPPREGVGRSCRRRQPARRRGRRGRAHAWRSTRRSRASASRPGGGRRAATSPAPARRIGEKQVASVVATACDLPRAVCSRRLRRVGPRRRSALPRARATPCGRRLRRPLVVGRRRAPGGARLASSRALLGDGAAAAMLGRDGDVIAELVEAASVVGGVHLPLAHRRAARAAGGGRALRQPVRLRARRAGRRDRGAARAPSCRPARVAQLCLAVPDARAAADCRQARRLRPGDAAACRSLRRSACSGTPIRCCCCRARSSRRAPGDFIVVAAYGEGADVLLFRATDALAGAPAARRSTSGSRRRRRCRTYERWLRARGRAAGRRRRRDRATVLEWKELKQDVRLYGSRCEACGLVQYPMAQVCVGCRRPRSHGRRRSSPVGRGLHLHHRQSGAGARASDADGRGRPRRRRARLPAGHRLRRGDIAIGKRVRLTFRRLHEAGGNRNYFWKVRPA